MLSDYASAIAILLAAVVAIPAYFVQKREDRRYELWKTRADTYRHFFGAFWENQEKAGTSEASAAHNKYQRAVHDVYVVASDEVFLATSDFYTYFVDNRGDLRDKGEDIDDKYAALIVAMRKDGFQPTRLSKDAISSRLRFDVS